MPDTAFKIVADENIPFAEQGFGKAGVVRLMGGREIDREAVEEADILLVRSVTRVDAALLEGSAVRFVGSATIGTDHVDQDFLREKGIVFAHAPASNADSVVEYVLAALLCLAVRDGSRLEGKTIGIVGCGNIGGRLARRLPALGLNVLKNDPPLEEKARTANVLHDYLPLEEVLDRSDIVTLHVPLTREGPYATRHLLDAARLNRMKPGAWLLNTCRGAVVSNVDLKNALGQGSPGSVVLDVWENEPTPDPELLRRVNLGTPHIAGYSFDGKVRGTVMLYQALVQSMGFPAEWDYESALAATGEDKPALVAPGRDQDGPDWLNALVRQMYDIVDDDARMRSMPTHPAEARAPFFNELRKHYPRRRTFPRFNLARQEVPAHLLQAVEEGLDVNVTG